MNLVQFLVVTICIYTKVEITTIKLSVKETEPNLLNVIYAEQGKPVSLLDILGKLSVSKVQLRLIRYALKSLHNFRLKCIFIFIENYGNINAKVCCETKSKG
jgi:hypothetical protein